MNIFVTGATGFVGSAVVSELLGAGHEVTGLARSDESARKLTEMGADVQRGSLDDLESLRDGAAASDGVIHTAFNHDFSNFAASCELDRRAIEAMGGALEDSQRPIVVTSGVAFLASGRLATENDAAPTPGPNYPRASEAAALALAARGVRASTVRLAPSVHGKSDYQGFVPILIKTARDKGVSAYIGDGQNRWPGVHYLDAATLFRLALERGATGAAWHGIADEGVAMRQIAEIIGKHLNVPVVSKSPDEAGEHFGWFASFAGVDAPASSAITQQKLGWNPSRAGLVADLEAGFYFDN